MQGESSSQNRCDLSSADHDSYFIGEPEIFFGRATVRDEDDVEYGKAIEAEQDVMGLSKESKAPVTISTRVVE